MKKITFLGHIVSKEGVKPNPSKIKTIIEWETPNNMTEIWSFLRLAGYYKRFMKDFSIVTWPSTNLLKKSMQFRWTNMC